MPSTIDNEECFQASTPGGKVSCSNLIEETVFNINYILPNWATFTGDMLSVEMLCKGSWMDAA